MIWLPATKTKSRPRWSWATSGAFAPPMNRRKLRERRWSFQIKTPLFAFVKMDFNLTWDHSKPCGGQKAQKQVFIWTYQQTIPLMRPFLRMDIVWSSVILKKWSIPSFILRQVQNIISYHALNQEQHCSILKERKLKRLLWVYPFRKNASDNGETGYQQR